jgi:Tol biopolymer transport system component
MVRQIMLAGLLVISPFLTHCQLLEFSPAVKLPAAVNSAAEEGIPLLSPDGKKLFFSRALFDDNEGGVYAGQDIWISEYSSGNWKKASNDFGINNKNNNAVVGISADGKTFYFVNASPFQKMDGIYRTRTLDRSRSDKPELIPIPGIDNQDFIGFYVSPDLEVIFLSMKAPDTGGKEDLYYSVKSNGVWSRPRNLGATINTSGFEISPFLSADKKRLYFSSNGHPGSGDADIFYSERLYDSWETWSAPVNLGTTVNSNKFDAYFSLYGDTLAFFASNREGKYADLYQATARKARTILQRGQRYLTVEEWNSIIGKNVSADFAFPHRSASLAPGQKELLFYIVNKLMLKKDIRFHLVVKETESSELSKERTKAIYDHLKQLGIDPGRIVIEQVGDASQSGRGVIQIRLFQ